MRRLLVAFVTSMLLVSGCSSSPVVEATTTSTTIANAETLPIVATDVPVSEAVHRADLRLLAVRPNNPSLALIDLESGDVTTYPHERTGLPGDAISGAAITPRGDVAVWIGDTA